MPENAWLQASDDAQYVIPSIRMCQSDRQHSSQSESVWHADYCYTSVTLDVGLSIYVSQFSY
jgi:hypothetical protein